MSRVELGNRKQQLSSRTVMNDMLFVPYIDRLEGALRLLDISEKRDVAAIDDNDGRLNQNPFSRGR
jgi:hypothetical protein